MAILVSNPNTNGINASEVGDDRSTLLVKIKRLSIQRIAGTCMVDVEYLGDFYGCDAFSFKINDESGNMVKQAYEHLMSIEPFCGGVKY